MILDFELPRDATRIWDIYVPIVKSGNVTTAYLTNEISNPELYNELCYLLKVAKKTDKFILNINTPGGALDSANMIIDAITSSPATVVASLSGTVASAGTIITLACDEIEIADYTAWMTHNYSGGLVG